MSTVCYFPSSGSSAVAPTPDSGTWTLHTNSDSRPLNFANGGTALASLTYNPDAGDHLVDGNTMVAQFVSQILPPQSIPAQQILWGARMAESFATNDLFPMLRLYACSVDGTTNLGTILAGTRQATELAATVTGVCYIQAGSAITPTAPWRLVAEWGGGGLPTASVDTDSHNMSIAFGEVLATDLFLIQNGDTSVVPPMIIFSETIKMSITPPMDAIGVRSPPVGRGW